MDLYRVVTLDDGREALVYGVCGDRWDTSLDLMFADGSVLHDVEPERVKKNGAKLPVQMTAHPKPWPEPWATAQRRLREDVQANRSRKAKALPKPKGDVAARIGHRLAESARIRAWRAAQEERAWRCEDDAEAILAEAGQKDGAYIVHLDHWAWLKRGAPDRVVLYWSGQYVYTYHVDALQVSKVKPLPPTQPYWITQYDGPVVLIFDEFDYYLEELLVPLVAAGVKVALVQPGWHDSPSRLELFDDGEDVQRYVDREREEQAAEIRMATVASKGTFQETLPGFR